MTFSGGKSLQVTIIAEYRIDSGFHSIAGSHITNYHQALEPVATEYTDSVS